MSFKIRLLQIADLQQESFYQTLSALRPIKKIADSLAEEIFNDCQKRGIETYVVLDKEKIVGTLRLLFESKFYHQGRLAAHIEDVATHADYQGKGVGRVLVQHAITVCRARACYKIILDCSDRVAPFYQKQGFVLHENCLRYDLDND
ncbi:GNAT family N-acetyltransferase [Patescibacteria group bacterium]|nr:GNAT family N-acetyltransferase [Patescibacteria group bacterium]